MLSRVQARIASLIAQLPEASGFALAGGAALIVRGDVERTTRDLDFFAADPEAVRGLLPALERALNEAGLVVERVQDGDTFVRLQVGGSDGTQGYDPRLLDAEQGPTGPVLAGEELAANKLLALCARAEARDFIDVHALSRRYGFDRIYERAGEKDTGLRPEALLGALTAFARLPRQASMSTT